MPPEPAPVTKANSTETAQTKKAGGDQQQLAKNEAAPLETGEGKPNTQNTGTRTKQELEINRQLARFTGLLVLVGLLQLMALAVHATIFWRTLKENRRLIQASQRTADAALAGAQASTISANAAAESNSLTRESNEITAAVADLTRRSVEEAQRSNAANEALLKESNGLTAEATKLTREAFILGNRPKLVVRDVVVDDVARLINYRHIPGGPSSDPLIGNVLTVNVGGTPANLTDEYSEVIFKRAGEPLSPGDNRFQGRPTGAMRLPPGVNTRAIGFSTPAEEPLSDTLFDDILTGEVEVFLLGWIGYRDELENYRHTSYCRKWDLTRLRFVYTDDPDYESAD
jgi:hypothetical protein